MTDLDSYAPKAATTVRALEGEVERLRALAPKPEHAEPAFAPEVLPPELQEIVDDIPEMLGWQVTEANQEKWQAVKAADVLLSKLPQWKNKPLADRFTAAMNQVKVLHEGAAPAPTPEQIAQAKIDALPVTVRPVAAGSLRSGETPGNELPDYHRMAREGMTDEQIIASLSE